MTIPNSPINFNLTMGLISMLGVSLICLELQMRTGVSVFWASSCKGHIDWNMKMTQVLALIEFEFWTQFCFCKDGLMSSQIQHFWKYWYSCTIWKRIKQCPDRKNIDMIRFVNPPVTLSLMCALAEPLPLKWHSVPTVFLADRDREMGWRDGEDRKMHPREHIKYPG